MTLVWAPGFNGITDPDAQTYIAAVEAADGQAIEGNVAYAINDFVVGCKTDGIWDAIKASCILAGARTLSGALVPLKGTAPTNYNFVSGDYNRELGLTGDKALNKYLDSNRANNADPQDSNHNSVYVTTVTTAPAGTYPYYSGSGGNVGGANSIGRNPTDSGYVFRNRTSSANVVNPGTATGLVGTNRSSSANYVARFDKTNTTITRVSQSPNSSNILVFTLNDTTSTSARDIDGTISFYSIGEAIDLEKLDTRTTRLMNLLSYSLASGLPALSSMDIDAALYIGAIYRAGGTLS